MFGKNNLRKAYEIRDKLVSEYYTRSLSLYEVNKDILPKDVAKQHLEELRAIEKHYNLPSHLDFQNKVLIASIFRTPEDKMDIKYLVEITAEIGRLKESLKELRKYE